MPNTGLNLIDHLHIVEGLFAVTPSSSTPDYVSVKNARSVAVVISFKNATTVTGSAITLKQASDVAATGEKALSFTTYYSVTDNAASDVPWVKNTAASDTFTTSATNSKNGLYVIPVDPSTLDTANGFDCVRAGTGNGTATTVAVYYIIVPKYGGNPILFPSFIID